MRAARHGVAAHRPAWTEPRGPRHPADPRPIGPRALDPRPAA
jgi:hypothetical protein